MRRIVVLPALAIVLLAGCDFGDDEEESAAAKADFVATLGRLNQDKEFGVVGITSEPSGRTRVFVEVFESAAGRQNAEIRRGNCDVIDSATAYPLSPVEDGTSETLVRVPLRELRRSGYLVLVLDRGEEFNGVCADLARSQPPDAAPIFE